MNKVVATGYHNSYPIKVECIEDNGVIFVYLNDRFDVEFGRYLSKYIIDRWNSYGAVELDNSFVFNPEPTSLEAYWLALHEINYFDTLPNVVVIGDLQLEGSPYESPYKTSKLNVS